MLKTPQIPIDLRAHAHLIAWQRPLYQVLALDVPAPHSGLPTNVATQLERLHAALGKRHA
ncbi:hypothetical protein [Paraburkholderia aspalathi]|uniref:hypothetical protein n=1 Tax=Paraburkholderia aspalathi TaxID=1324617 RepID=UPI0019093268|nr:hypothetical protein [Paraburkholderia aspalathi]MBK3844721.1 hypothetical protein [Paraburkholderia aspalathi]